MKSTVAIIDYGMGNLFSVSKAFEYCGAEVVITDSAVEIDKAQKLVLPGVGAFKDGMNNLCKRNLIEPIKRFALSERPLLGICLGMQMLLEMSEEFGVHEGLGLIPGKVVAIPETDLNGFHHKIPHVGWNQLSRPVHLDSWKGTLLSSIEPQTAVYFIHSFAAQPLYKDHYLAECSYNGHIICAAIQSNFLSGCQFHPEKSGKVGLRIIKNFLELKI